jgi:hypothetical protein
MRALLALRKTGPLGWAEEQKGMMLKVDPESNRNRREEEVCDKKEPAAVDRIFAGAYGVNDAPAAQFPAGQAQGSSHLCALSPYLT